LKAAIPLNIALRASALVPIEGGGESGIEKCGGLLRTTVVAFSAKVSVLVMGEERHHASCSPGPAHSGKLTHSGLENMVIVSLENEAAQNAQMDQHSSAQ
jgi:hypothetical protein